MSFIYSRALVEEYSAANCSGTDAFAQSRESPTHKPSWWHDKTMEPSRHSRFGMTYAPLTESLGAALLTWFVVDSLAKTSVRPEQEKGLTESAPVFGVKWRELSVRYDLSTSSWRTHRSLWDEDLSACSLTLPRWGLMRDGVLSEQTTLEHRTSVNAYGLWPTPVASGTGDRKRPYAQGGTPLSLAVKYMTPTAQIGKKCGGRHNGKADTLASQIAELEGLKQTSTGRLNPLWVEWLMGWPTGWTDCTALGMGRFREWLRQHSNFCESRSDAA